MDERPHGVYMLIIEKEKKQKGWNKTDAVFVSRCAYTIVEVGGMTLNKSNIDVGYQ